MKTVRIKVSDDLVTQVDELVKAGWFPSRDSLFEEALRKFVNSHRPEVLEKQILDDVEWGLRGGK